LNAFVLLGENKIKLTDLSKVVFIQLPSIVKIMWAFNVLDLINLKTYDKIEAEYHDRKGTAA
jgi:hypothetical protein